jgi:large subunit ribosomal protein L29
MAIEKLTDFSSYADIELQGELDKLASTYQTLRFEHAIKGLETPKDLQTVRRNIARVNTEVRRREIEAGVNVGNTKKQSRRKKH